MLNIILLSFLFSFNTINSDAKNYCWQDAPIIQKACSEEKKYEYLILFHGSPKCGGCRMLMQTFQDAEIPENAKIIFLMRDISAEYLEEEKINYRCQEVRLTTTNQDPCAISLLPTVQLFRLKNKKWKKVKTYKGYSKSVWKNISKKCSK